MDLGANSYQKRTPMPPVTMRTTKVSSTYLALVTAMVTFSLSNSKDQYVSTSDDFLHH
jgi:hypothetical protein